MIELKDIGYAIRGRPILENLNGKLRTGEVTGLVGRNGAGKSTLIKIAAGLLKPDSGQVLYSGSRIDDPRQLARRRAVLSQSFHSHFDFTVLDLLMMSRFAQASFGAADLEVLSEIVLSFDLRHLLKRQLPSLSGGELQRARFAAAVAQLLPLDRTQPKFLFLDEPTNSTDLALQQVIFRLIHKIASTAGCGVLVAVHDLNQAASACDRLWVLDSGRICCEGTASEVLTVSCLRNHFQVDARIQVCPSTGRPLIAI